MSVANIRAQGGLGAPQDGRTGHHRQDMSHHLTREWSTGHPMVRMGTTSQGQVTNPREEVDAGSAGPWAGMAWTWNDWAGTGALLFSCIKI